MEAYQRYRPALLRKGQRLLQNRADAEDVVQELFTDLLEKNQTQWELPYLYRALTNRCLNRLRDRTTQQRLLTAQEASLRGPVRTRCDDRAINLDLLVKLLDRLGPEEIEVLIYRFYDDLTQREIADLLGVNRKTVIRRLEAIEGMVCAMTANGSGVSP